MTGYTHSTPEPEGEYFATCMAETSCGHTMISDDPAVADSMLEAHYVVDHGAGAWNRPLDGGRG